MPGLQRNHLVVGTAGNVSVHVQRPRPSGVGYGAMTADQVGVHRLDGVLVDAPLKPSSEFPLHLAAYRNTGASAIVHTYGVVSTAISTVVDEIPPSHYYTGPFGGIARVARCASFGTDDLAHNVVTAGIRRLRVDTVVMSTSAVIDYVTYHPRRKPTC